MEIQIKVNPSGAIPAIAGVENALEKVEGKAGQVSKAIGNLAEEIGNSGSAAGALKDHLTSMIGPAALVAAGISAVGEEMDRMARHRERLIDASNALLKFYDTAGQANSALGEQEQLSNDLHLSLGKTVEAYSAVREATADLHLTSGQMVDVTRNLTAALVIDGKAASDVSGIMGRFQVAMELGTLSGRDFKAILRESPDVAELLADALGKTVAQVQAMANEGKITKGVMGQMIAGLADGDKTMEKFSQRTLTMKGVMEEMDLGFADAIVYIQKAQEGFHKAEISVAEFSLRIIKLNTEIVPDLIKNLKGITAQGIIDANVAATKKIVEDWKKRSDAAKAYAETVEMIGEGGGNKAFTRTKDADGFSLAGGFGTGSGAAAGDASTGANDILTAQGMGLKNNLVMWAEQRQMLIDTFDATKKWNDELHKTDETAAVLGQTLLGSVGTFSDSLVDAANGADVAWGKMFENLLVDIEKALLKAMILQAITGSASGSAGAGVHGGFGGLLGLFGGANGFDAMVPGGRGAFLPGFATGGDMMVGGSGGTDSKIAAFRVTPGESIHVRTPAQQQAAQQGSQATPNINVHVRQNERDLMAPLASGAADVHLNAWARRNPGLLRTVLSK